MLLGKCWRGSFEISIAVLTDAHPQRPSFPIIVLASRFPIKSPLAFTFVCSVSARCSTEAQLFRVKGYWCLASWKDSFLSSCDSSGIQRVESWSKRPFRTRFVWDCRQLASRYRRSSYIHGQTWSQSGATPTPEDLDGLLVGLYSPPQLFEAI